MRRWWLWTALGAALLLVGSGQEWVGARVVDPVLGGSTLSLTGTEAGRTLVAGALLAGASVLGGLVGARVVRIVAGCFLLAAAVLTGWPAVQAVTDPTGVASGVARSLPGHVTGTVVAEGATVSLWPWLALLGSALVALGGLTLLAHTVRRGHAGTDRGRSAAAGQGPAGGAEPTEGAPPATGAARTDVWEELTRGGDPTVED